MGVHENPPAPIPPELAARCISWAGVAARGYIVHVLGLVLECPKSVGGSYIQFQGAGTFKSRPQNNINITSQLFFFRTPLALVGRRWHPAWHHS
jgi:hypothetical protein